MVLGLGDAIPEVEEAHLWSQYSSKDVVNFPGFEREEKGDVCTVTTWLLQKNILVQDGVWYGYEHTLLCKVCGCIVFFNWTSPFYCSVVCWWSKNKHDEDTYFQKIGLSLQFITLQLNNKYIWEECFDEHALGISTPNPWEVQLSVWFLPMLCYRFANAPQALCEFNG